MAKVLIAGCGYLGKELAKILIEDEHEVWALNRNKASLPKGVRQVIADLSKSETLAQLPQDFDYLFYTAAAKEHSEDAYRRAYYEGMNNILGALEKSSNLKRAFFSSSTSVYHQNDGSWVDENSATLPQDFSGKLMLETENLLKRSAVESSSVRFAGLYGAERTRLVRSVIEGTAKLSSRTEYTNRIHITDAARLLHHLMNLQDLKETYIGVDHCPSDKNEVLSWLAGQLGVKVVSKMDEPLHPLRSNKRCSNKRIVETDFSFLYPSYKEGYKEICQTQKREP